MKVGRINQSNAQLMLMCCADVCPRHSFCQYSKYPQWGRQFCMYRICQSPNRGCIVNDSSSEFINDSRRTLNEQSVGDNIKTLLFTGFSLLCKRMLYP